MKASIVRQIRYLLATDHRRARPTNHVRQVEFEAVEPDAVVPLFDGLARAEVLEVLGEIGLAEFDGFAAPHAEFIFVVGVEGGGVEDDRVTYGS